MAKVQHHYSGKLSKKFWDRVNSLPEPSKMEIYMCGVILQDIESRVLLWLQNAEVSAKIRRKRG